MEVEQFSGGASHSHLKRETFPCWCLCLEPGVFGGVTKALEPLEPIGNAGSMG